MVFVDGLGIKDSLIFYTLGTATFTLSYITFKDSILNLVSGFITSQPNISTLLGYIALFLVAYFTQTLSFVWIKRMIGS